MSTYQPTDLDHFDTWYNSEVPQLLTIHSIKQLLTTAWLNGAYKARESQATPIQIPPEHYEEFQQLIQRGANLWPDASPFIKDFADKITNGEAMQDYYKQANIPRNPS